MFHAKDGLFFDRTPNGGVLVVLKEFDPLGQGEPITKAIELDCDTWGSVVAQVNVAVTINGRGHSVPPGRLTYAMVVSLAGLIGQPSVTFKAAGIQSGILHVGEMAPEIDGIVFNVAHTNRA